MENQIPANNKAYSPQEYEYYNDKNFNDTIYDEEGDEAEFNYEARFDTYAADNEIDHD
jgi:hypothetical protein